MVLRKDSDANLPGCNVESIGEVDRSLIASDSKTRSLHQSLTARASNTELAPLSRLAFNHRSPEAFIFHAWSEATFRFCLHSIETRIDPTEQQDPPNRDHEARR